MPTPISTQLKSLIAQIAEEVSKEVDLDYDFDCTAPEFRPQRSLDISISQYLERFVEFFSLDEANVIVALVFFDRFRGKNPKHAVTPYNVHLILTILIMAEQKLNSDGPYRNVHFNTIGGIHDLVFLNAAEGHMYKFLSWELDIPTAMYERYKVYLYAKINLQLLATSALPIEKTRMASSIANDFPEDNGALLSRNGKVSMFLGSHSFLSPPRNSTRDTQSFSVFSVDSDIDSDIDSNSDSDSDSDSDSEIENWSKLATMPLS